MLDPVLLPKGAGRGLPAIVGFFPKTMGTQRRESEKASVIDRCGFGMLYAVLHVYGHALLEGLVRARFVEACFVLDPLPPGELTGLTLHQAEILRQEQYQYTVK